MLDKELQHLNDKQKQAVMTLRGNMLVVAPAGTGKTKVIALRTARMLQAKIPSCAILCLTFTNKAAKEMGKRIEAYTQGNTKGLMIKTFHSFCYEIIKAEKKHSHFAYGVTILDEMDGLKIIEALLLDTQKVEPQAIKTPVREVQYFIEEVKKYSLSLPIEKWYDYPFLMEAYVKNHSIKNRELFKYGLHWLSSYENILKQNNCIDFTDLIIEATYLMHKEEVLKKWQRFVHIQIDEMQDTSIREYDLIKKIGEGSHIALFGDFNQTIYEWRGSNPYEMLEDFKQKYNPVEIVLTKNYRSTKRLLDAANHYIRSSALYPLEVGSALTDYGEPIEIFVANSKKEEFEGIATFIKQQSKEPRKQAVLVRTNAYAKEAYDALTRFGIDCLKVEEIKLFRKKEVKDFLAYFTYLMNPRNEQAMVSLLQHPYFQIEQWLFERLKKTKEIHLGLQDWFLLGEDMPYESLFQAYQKNQVVILDVESTGLDTTRDDLVQIAAIVFGKDGVKRTLDVLVKPTQLVGNSFYVHGFSDEILQKEGLEPVEALEKLREFCEGSILVGHNVGYDMQILRSMFERYKLSPLEYRGVYDTLDLSKKVCGPMNSYTLEYLASYLQTKHKPNHNALADILATGEILTYLLENLEKTFSSRLAAMEELYPYVLPYKGSLQKLCFEIQQLKPHEAIVYLMNERGFKSYYTEEELVCIRDFYKVAKALYEEELSEDDNRMRLLTFCALHYTELEQTDFFKNKLPIMTVHQAKGLEFDEVYLAGCNERIFPSARSVKEGSLMEEKRLFYVAITRAKQKLCLSYTTTLPRSYFLEEMGEDFVFIDKKMLNSNKKDRKQ
jgi:DNA helicase-2/ATP-dependent DNA helicase PcrA